MHILQAIYNHVVDYLLKNYFPNGNFVLFDLILWINRTRRWTEIRVAIRDHTQSQVLLFFSNFIKFLPQTLNFSSSHINFGTIAEISRKKLFTISPQTPICKFQIHVIATAIMPPLPPPHHCHRITVATSISCRPVSTKFSPSSLRSPRRHVDEDCLVLAPPIFSALPLYLHVLKETFDVSSYFITYHCIHQR